MKIIYRYLFKKFLGPFALTFFFALFVLLMQYLWRYVDELVGKGLEISVVLEFLFYASGAGMVVLAAPLAVLLASLMTFGSLGEQYEIIAMKSAGISIRKLIFSLALCSFIIAIGSFCFADKVAPRAYFKMRTLLRNIRDQKPTLAIEEGVFYNGFDNYSIRVGRKGRNNVDIYDILLSDHSKYQGNTTFTYAKRGKMQATEDKMYMLFYLYDGFLWDESTNSNNSSKNPLARYTFSEQYKKFDISSFKFEKSDDNFYSRKEMALSNSKIVKTIDTIMISVEKNNEDIMTCFFSSCNSFKSFIYSDEMDTEKTNTFKMSYNDFNTKEKRESLDKIIALKNDFKNELNMNREYKKYLMANINSYRVEWLKKYVIATACILFFFIGAPLGSIIRKGGIGVPLVITVAFFSTYFMLSIFGEKLAKGGAVPVWFGTWLSTFIILPICAFLTYQASVDSALLSSEELYKKLQQLNLNKFFVRKKNENTATHA
ncbi:MAG: LptF/LptG family permease [Bacteroidetes bacterium]|nr:LptF/LptG family permease [Bacteroidota bacterium]MCL1968269.1 LptF/LptG family permease [Bacteroidota bacterium]